MSDDCKEVNHNTAHSSKDGPVRREDEIDIIEVLQILWKGRRLILSLTVAGALVSGIISVLQPNVYTATATIMPTDSSTDRVSSALSAMGAMGGLASQAGVNLKGSVSDKFIVFLNSRSITENVITKHRLLPVLYTDRWDASKALWKPASIWFAPSEVSRCPSMQEACRQMRKTMNATADPKSGLISIQVNFKYPQVAADIANYYVLELNNYLKNNSFSSAKRNRDFLEGQVNGVLKDLGSLENSLKTFQEKNKLVSLDAQTQAAVQAYANLKSQLTAKEMELSLQANSVSSEDSEVVGIKQEISQLKEQISLIEQSSSGGLIGFKDAPELGMRFAQLKRDLLVKQQVFELLTQQLELAKLDEAKETLSFQVVDRAIAPDQKSKPLRSRNVLIATIACFLLSTFLVVVGSKLFTNVRLKHLSGC